MAVVLGQATENARKMKPRLCLGELTWVEPAIQSKTSTWSGVNLEKQLPSVTEKPLLTMTTTKFSEHPQQTIVLRKTAGQQPGSGHCCVRFSSVTSKPAIWSCDTGRRILCFDRCQLSITWMEVQYQKM